MNHTVDIRLARAERYFDDVRRRLRGRHAADWLAVATAALRELERIERDEQRSAAE